MKKFQVEFKYSVKKDLKKIESRFLDKIFLKVKQLENFPQVPGFKKLSGVKNIFRLRLGDYRIVFQVFEKESKIVICYIRHRGSVYREISGLY